jgi:hypothetical protein
MKRTESATGTRMNAAMSTPMCDRAHDDVLIERPCAYTVPPEHESPAMWTSDSKPPEPDQDSWTR